MSCSPGFAAPAHTGTIVIRADSGFENHKLFKTFDRRGVEFSIGVKQLKTIRALIEEIHETAWITLADYPEGGEAQIAETKLAWLAADRPPHPPGRQAGRAVPRLALPRVRDQPHRPLLPTEADHREHAVVELAIRDLKDQALAHFPSGQYAANSAWTVIAALAHNLGRWTSLIGLPHQPVHTARTRRHQLFRIPGRLTRTARQWTLRMPARWPWQTDFTTRSPDPRAPRARLTRPRSPPTPINRSAGNGAQAPARKHTQTSPTALTNAPRPHQPRTDTPNHRPPHQSAPNPESHHPAIRLR